MPAASTSFSDPPPRRQAQVAPADSHTPVRRLALLERGGLSGIAAGTLAAVLLVAKNELAPVQWPSTFGWEFGRWLTLEHLIAALAVALLAVAAQSRVPRLARGLVRLWPLTILALAWAGNARAVEWFGAWPQDRFRALLLCAWVLAQAALVAGAAVPLARRWPTRLLTAAAAGAFLLAVSPRADAGTPVRATPAHLRMDGDTLLVFGIDGADWAYVDPLIARGLMPNLARLRADGAWGPLQSMTPTDSPVIWTTIATGQPPRRHGVRGFTLGRMRGVQTPLRRMKPVRLLGYESLEEWLEERGILFDAPVSSLVRREPALWNLMSDAGRPVTVLNWWATWPAERVVGRMVSERVYHWRSRDRGFRPEDDQLTHPPELHAAIAGDLVAPEAISYEQARAFVDVDHAEFDRMMATPFSKRMLESELRYFLSMYETNVRVARRLVRMDRDDYGRPADLLVLERLVDMACHAALKESELVADHLDASGERLRKFGRVVTAAYAAVDRQLGELLEAYGDGNVVVLSDHGFHLVPHRRTYGHGDAPSGIFVAHGPAFRSGRVEGLSVHDMFPLLARIRSLPLADDLAGRLPDEVLSTSARAIPVHRVTRYGAHASATSSAPAAYDQEMLERLRALGYVQ